MEELRIEMDWAGQTPPSLSFPLINLPLSLSLSRRCARRHSSPFLPPSFSSSKPFLCVLFPFSLLDRFATPPLRRLVLFLPTCISPHLLPVALTFPLETSLFAFATWKIVADVSVLFSFFFSLSLFLSFFFSLSSKSITTRLPSNVVNQVFRSCFGYVLLKTLDSPVGRNIGNETRSPLREATC